MGVKPKRSIAELLQSAAGALAALAGLIAYATKAFVLLNRVLPYSLRIPQSAQTPLAAAIVLIGGFFLWNGLRVRSRLLRPEALLINPDNPEHLAGRDEDVDRVTGLARRHAMVLLAGESGAGKSALLRAGVISRIESDFIPVYVDTWGADWEHGPIRELREALAQKLGHEGLKKLGFGASFDDEKLFEALRQCSPKLGRRALIVLDQFDDYQSQHRNRFLIDQTWISSEALVSQNLFWRGIRDLVAADKAHLIATTRTDAADGLVSIRFLPDCQNYRLDRLLKSVVEPLLTHLTTPAGEEAPIVASPENGWTQLRSRLAAALGGDEATGGGSVLGAQMRVAFAGLVNLNPLSVGSFEAIQGLRGLEAAYIRRYISEAARSSGLSEEQTRTMLMSMVADRKTTPRTVSELRAALASGGSGADGSALDKQLTDALDDLISKRIVRRPPNALSGEPKYALVHDYLCNGVLEAERQANLWLDVLKKRHHDFDGVVGSPWRRWRALLPATLSIRLALHRIRGKFRYGVHGTYAARSLFRFAPMILIAAAIAGTAVVANNLQRDFFAQQEEIEHTARAIRTFQSIGLDPPTAPLSPEEADALWEIAQSEYAERRALLGMILESPSNAQRFIRRSSYVLRALWGLNRELAQALCEACWPRDSWNSDNPDILRAQAIIGASLPEMNGALLESVLSNTPLMIGSASERDDLSAIAGDIATFARGSDAAAAKRYFDQMSAHASSYYRPNQQVAASVVLAALAERMTRDDVRVEFSRRRSLSRTQPGVERRVTYGAAVSTMGARLGRAEAQASVEDMLGLAQDIRRTSFLSGPGVVSAILDGIEPAVKALSNTDAAGDFEALLSPELLRTWYSADNWQRPYEQLLASIGTRLDVEAAGRIFRRCWTADWQSLPVVPASCLPALAPRLAPATAAEHLRLLLTSSVSVPSGVRLDYGNVGSSVAIGLTRAISSPDAAKLLVVRRAVVAKSRYYHADEGRLLSALASRVDPADVSSIFAGMNVTPAVTSGCDHNVHTILGALDGLKTRVGSSFYNSQSYLQPAYGELLRRTVEAIPLNSVSECFKSLAQPFTPNVYPGDSLTPNALAMVGLAPRLRGDDMSSAYDILTREIKEVQNVDALNEMAGALEAMGPQVSLQKANTLFKLFYGGIENPQTLMGSYSSDNAQILLTRRSVAYARALSGLGRAEFLPVIVKLLMRPDQSSQQHGALLALFETAAHTRVDRDTWKAVKAAESLKLEVRAFPIRFENIP